MRLSAFLQHVRGPKLRPFRQPTHPSGPSQARWQSSPALDEITEDDKNRIYFLGLGNKGTLVAACMGESRRRPPITLLTANEARADARSEAGQKISMFVNGEEVVTGGYDVEVIPKRKRIRQVDSKSDDSKSSIKKKVRPILNLVCAIRSKWAAGAIFEIKHRLLPNSTVLVIADGLGVLEEIFNVNFPDARTRPSFRLGLSNHGVWERSGLATNPYDYKDSVTQVLAGLQVATTGYSLNYDGSGELMIGPLAVDSLSTSRLEEAQRMNNAQYLVNHLLDSPRLSALEVPHRKLLFQRYRKLAKDAVVGPLVTYFECPGEELIHLPDAQFLMANLIKEAWEVVRRDLPGTPIEEVRIWIRVELYVTRHPSKTKIHSMASYAIRGMDTGIEKINGWLIGRARQYGIRLPTHELMMDFVIKKTVERSKLLKEQALAEQQSKSQPVPEVTQIRRVPYGQGDQDEAKPYEERPDRLTIRREKKAQRQREGLGNQPMPETYAKPRITPLGNAQIRHEKTGPGGSENGPSDAPRNKPRKA
ncbi:uncharacterized protein LY89DRAFT_678456 [Mollisia scopiformis]|uniref:Ketopantoate reductase C-terminal domain-containing protein n=1 Tax=Mollisia scopiformis TaxID=149040 RepID=A0A132B5D0_MOLSC|nr:uncharacterized protein LY89DRAFT_678456 [Mollisia scopiformis]KUJ06877.1 hypothetical protein LY89DRAFT_678456 [Mollisia scopiformis]